MEEHYVFVAPFGYSYIVDEAGKKIIIPNEKAEIVKEIFLFITDFGVRII